MEPDATDVAKTSMETPKSKKTAARSEDGLEFFVLAFRYGISQGHPARNNRKPATPNLVLTEDEAALANTQMASEMHTKESVDLISDQSTLVLALNR